MSVRCFASGALTAALITGSTFLGLIALRVLWLGQSWAVFVHQLGNGALLLFAFFMISDPMTIPNRRSMRLMYALIVALGAFAWQYVLFKPNALVWALFLCTPLVPLLDWLAPGDRFAWRSKNTTGPSPGLHPRGERVTTAGLRP